MFRNLLTFNRAIVCKPYLHYPVVQKTYSTVQNQPSINGLRSQKFSSLLSDYGFNPGQISRILKSPESVLSLSEDQLLSNLKIWLYFDGNDKIFTVLSAYPELLTLNPDYVSNRIVELMTLFTKKDIQKLLVTCPVVFTNDFSDTYDKMEYIIHMMGVEQKSIVKCQALQFDLYHIKCRHNFLIRAGRYIVNKKAKKSRNPPLDKVLSTNINKFLKLTNLSKEEFESFCHCFVEEEIERQEEEEEAEEYRFYKDF